MLGRQLHKRRLMPAPKPFILDPLPVTPALGRASVEPGSSYDLNGRKKDRSDPSRSSSAALPSDDDILEHIHNELIQQPTAIQTKDDVEESHQEPDDMGLALELLGLEDGPQMLNLHWGLPRLGESPRNKRANVKQTTVHEEEPNIDKSWVQHTVNFEKPDGRNYRLHEKRRCPPPQPILAPSVYAKEMAPAYTNAQLAKAMPEWKGHNMKHDLVTFLTTGKPLPGPSLAQIAGSASPLQKRLDEIHSTNINLVTKVETLWRLKQSWSMQRPENNQWRTSLERPQVLRKAPGRQFRTNLTVYDLTASVARDGGGQEGYEITQGTLFRKGVAKIPVAGRWSMFRGEPNMLGDPPPEDFRAPSEVQKEIRRRPKDEAREENVSPKGKPGFNIAQTDELMQGLLTQITDMEIDIQTMQRELATTETNVKEEPEEISVDEMRTTLVQDMTTLQKTLEDSRAQSKKNTGMGHIYLREGQLKEVELHEGMDGGGDDDDLEDLIRKPKMKRPTPHRDCFNPLSKQSVRR